MNCVSTVLLQSIFQGVINSHPIDYSLFYNTHTLIAIYNRYILAFGQYNDNAQKISKYGGETHYHHR